MSHNNKKNQDYCSVTVIIPSYNSHKTIGWTFTGIKAQTKYDLIKEIIVVDSSDDGITPDFLKSNEDNILKVTRSGSRVMPAIQRNIGAKLATGDLLCFVDSDAFPAPNWIELIIEEYNKGYLAGGGSYRVPESQQNKPIAFAQYFLEFSQFIGYGKRRHQIMIPSCNLFCDRTLFNKIGGFPIIRAAEDGFFGQKLNQYVNMLYIPEAVVYHIFRENKDHVLANLRLLGKYAYYYRRENYNHVIYKGILAYLFVPAFLGFRVTRIFVRVLRTNRNYVANFIKATPMIIHGTMMWGKGFMEGMRDYNKEKKVSKEEKVPSG